MNCLEGKIMNSRLNQILVDQDVENWYACENVYNVEGGVESFRINQDSEEGVWARISFAVAAQLRKLADSLEQNRGKEMQVNRA